MQDSVKKYFIKKINKPVPYTVELKSPIRGVVKREFEVFPLSIDGTIILVEVKVKDFNIKNMQTTMLPVSLGNIKLDIDSFPTPGDVIESICRVVSPEFFKGKPQQAIIHDNVLDIVQNTIMDLQKPGGVPNGEKTPNINSIQRLIKFIGSNPNLVPPSVFSSSDGTLRARWTHGSNKSIFVAFPFEGPLPLTISIPRQSDYGMVKVNARCKDDNDIFHFASELGIRMTKS